MAAKGKWAEQPQAGKPSDDVKEKRPTEAVKETNTPALPDGQAEENNADGALRKHLQAQVEQGNENASG